MSEERKILYRLTTKDGIKSEIRESDHFTLSILLAVKERLGAAAMYMSSGRIDEYSPAEHNSRTYIMRKHYTVEFVEYEEE